MSGVVPGVPGRPAQCLGCSGCLGSVGVSRGLLVTGVPGCTGTLETLLVTHVPGNTVTSRDTPRQPFFTQGPSRPLKARLQRASQFVSIPETVIKLVFHFQFE